jgi:hypothetical protein
MDFPLTQKHDAPRSRNLLFTSAGDNANLHHWLQGRRNFDLWVSYYGDEDQRYKDVADFHVSRKGGKFPNLNFVYENWKNIIDSYDAILVMDDDIMIDGSEISRLFEIREQYDLWILQPAFRPKGKVSHPITRIHPSCLLRFTNFVEVTCPLFRRDKLDEFMRVYDPELVGLGVDWWFLDVVGKYAEDKIAVVDEVSCVNPHDRTKGGSREIDVLQSRSDRIRTWEKMKSRYGISNRVPTEFAAIKGQLNFTRIVRSLETYTTVALLTVLRAIRR